MAGKQDDSSMVRLHENLGLGRPARVPAPPQAVVDGILRSAQVAGSQAAIDTTNTAATPGRDATTSASVAQTDGTSK